MTREDANFILANIDRRVCDAELSEALDMAIQALSAEPCEDTISRHAVLDAIRKSRFLVDAKQIIDDLPSVTSKQMWIPVSERLPERDGDYLVTYEKGYAEDYGFPPVGIVGFEVDFESFGYRCEYFDRQTLGSLGSEWEEIPIMAWMPLPEPYKAEREG